MLTSVVIPTFGRPELLHRAVESVLAQSIDCLELIVVVDGGDAASSSSLNANTDPRLSVVGTSVKLGPGGARNMGAKLAKGQWVAFLDDDDEWHPEKLERQLAASASQDVGDNLIVMTQSNVVTPYGRFVWPTVPFTNELPIDEWLFDRRSVFGGGESFLQTSSLMFPRRLFDTLEFADQPLHEDWELVLRAVKQHGYRLLTVTEPLVVHYVQYALPSLSQTNGWRASLAWGQNVGDLLTARAFAGFCLVTVARTAAARQEFSAILPLLRSAFRRGSPTAKQIVAFGLLWILPDSVRRSLRALFQSA